MDYKPTVLLIDDDTDDQEIFSTAMHKADESVNCIFANDGILALKKFNAEDDFIPDYIFIDMNMPGMNGQQCLKEIKKIDRLRNTPVFMYSTGADPVVMEENIKLGAVEFIVKPANIDELTSILSRIIKQKVIALMFILLFLSVIPGKFFAQTDTKLSAKELKKLSIDQLMNIVITSVSKSPEKLSEVASAIQVVTGEEIRRSGAFRLPGALRLATNLQVSHSGAHDTRVSSRGFGGFPVPNSSLSDKLLVLIDGRTVYTPLFGGVYWDVQNVLMEDIKQLEVISGPGGSIWGSNAVNGIINIISKSAKETQGVYASVVAGGPVKDFGAIRYGSHIDTTFFYRVYGQHFDMNSSTLTNGVDAKDAWNNSQGGFRMDYLPSNKTTFTLQGDLYRGKEDDSASTLVNGQNILARFTHTFSEKSGMTIQSYFDRTFRNLQNQNSTYELNTYDLDFQHNFLAGSRNKIVWGLDYRLASDIIKSVATLISPRERTLHLFSGFIQDQIELIPGRMDLTVGTKLLHNFYTNFEFQPTVRLAYYINSKNTLWSSVSRAVRTPNRLDGDFPSPVKFYSEKVIAYEMGYRVRPTDNLSFSIAAYYNQYTDLRSVEINQNPPPPFYYANNLTANTYGVEFSFKAILTNWWKLRGGYTGLHNKFKTTSPLTYADSYLLQAIDPANQFLLQSIQDLGKHFQLDGTVRYVDKLPKAITLPAVPSYLTFDLRLAYNYKWITVSIIGSNLAEKSRGSAGHIEIPRSVFGRVNVRF